MDERPHLEVCGRIPASSLDLEGQWNGASAVEEGQGEESVVSSSEAWHCGDADDLSSSHGHLFANQTMFVFVKKEPGDVPPTSTGENAHPDDSGNMSEFPLQVERHSDSGIVVKKETSESAFVRADEGSCPGASDSVPSLQVHLCGLWNEGQLSVIEVPDEILPTPTRDGIHVEESDRASPFRSVLEERWDNNCAVKEEPEDLPPTLADENVHPYDCSDMSEFPLQLKGYRDSGIPVKEEPEDAPPILAESVLPDDGTSMSDCPLRLESRGDSIIAVKEEPTDVEWQSLKQEESSHSFAHERCDQPRQEEQEEPKSYDCRFCPFSSFIKSKVAAHEKTHTGKWQFTRSHSQMAFPTRPGFHAHPNILGTKAHFKCCACSQISQRKADLLAHRKIHVYEKPYAGDTYGKRSPSKSSVTHHQDVHVDTNRIKCTRYQQTFKSKKNLMKHHNHNVCKEIDVSESTDRDERPFRCSECPKAFREKCDVPSQKKYHMEQRPFKCPRCAKVFQTKSRMSAHVITRPFRCLLCPKAFHLKCGLTTHKGVHIHISERPFKSSACPKAFRKKSFLTGHKLIRTNERPFNCVTFPEAFQTKSNLTALKVADTNKRIYKCAICHQIFRTLFCMKAHTVTHTDEKCFKCTTCPKSFKKRDHLRDHERIHSGERPFKCALCPKGFRTKFCLTRHEILHTDERPFKCSICPKAFPLRQYLTDHEEVHKVGKLFSCTSCNRTFVRKGWLTAHKKVHKDCTENDVSCTKRSGNV